MSAPERLTREDVLLSLDRARQALEQERRARFVEAFGSDPACLWPSSRLFHAHSALGPQWRPEMSIEDVERVTYDLAYKRYALAPQLCLPVSEVASVDLAEVIRHRRSDSRFGAAPLRLEQLAALLRAGAGVTAGGALPKRAAPSGGALFPIETYALAFNVAALDAGIYHYAPLDDVLEQVSHGEGAASLNEFIPPGLLTPPPGLVIALTARFARTQQKYLERGYRFALLEAGHIAQNVLLTATALTLPATPVGGFWDDPFNSLLELDGVEEAVVYAILLGSPS